MFKDGIWGVIFLLSAFSVVVDIIAVVIQYLMSLRLVQLTAEAIQQWNYICFVAIFIVVSEQIHCISSSGLHLVFTVQSYTSISL